MAVANITPPTVLATIDYSTGKDDAGVPLQWAAETRSYLASAAINIGDAVSLTGPTATAPITAHASDGDTAIDEATCVGIAQNTVAAGDIVSVGDVGYVRITDAATVAAGGVLPLTAAAGVCGASATLSEALGITSPFVALGASIVDFYGSGLDAALVKFRGV